MNSSVASASNALPASSQPALRTKPEARIGAINWLGSGIGRWLLSWPFPLALLLLWQLSSSYGWLSDLVLPPPQEVALTLWDLLRSGEMAEHLLVSLIRVLVGFAVGLAGGLALGTAMGLSPRVNDYVYPLFKAVSQVPVIGWLPLLMLLVGIGEALKFLLIAKAAMVPIAINTCEGIRGVPNSHVEVARVYGFTRWQLLRKVVLPAATAPIWNGVRLGFTHAWLALVVVELLASSEGIGFLIVYGRQLFQLDVVLAAVVVVGLVGYLLDKVLAGVEAWLLRWRRPVD